MIRPQERLPSPLVHGYLIQNPRKNLLIRIVDSCLGLATLGVRRDFPIAKPRRILLSNLAHMGDVLVASALLPILARRFPDAEIGFLLGSWSLPILKGHPGIARIHVLDHWMHNRSGKSLRPKVGHYLRTRSKALREIREARYDVAIDLYFYVGNSYRLLWQAGIPARIGYTSGGLAPLLTHRETWIYRDQHTAVYMAALLYRLGVPESDLAALRYSPSMLSRETSEKLSDGPYVVFHLGTGAELKEWPVHKWKELASRMAGAGHRLLFTGVGEREFSRVAEVIQGLSGCVNACNRLDWAGFLGALAGARAVVCPDTLAAHLAAAFGVPVVVLAAGIPNPYHWRPLSPQAKVLSQGVPCAPCFRSRGCAGMECVKDIAVERVHESLLAALQEDPAGTVRAPSGSHAQGQ